MPNCGATLFRFEATPDVGSDQPPRGGFVSMQALLPWTWQDHWHRELMRATWRRNAIDVWDALQIICENNVNAIARSATTRAQTAQVN
eukprot:gene54160-35364_t